MGLGGFDRHESKKKICITAPLTVVMIIALWSSGLFGLWSDGMAHLANNSKEYTDRSGHQVEGKYSLRVNLSDLESNIDKEIFKVGDTYHGSREHIMEDMTSDLDPAVHILYRELRSFRVSITRRSTIIPSLLQ